MFYVNISLFCNSTNYVENIRLFNVKKHLFKYATLRNFNVYTQLLQTPTLGMLIFGR